MEEIEKLIRSGGQPGSGYSLAALLDQAQTRLDSIRAEDDHVTADKKDKDQKERSAIAQMVEREAKLNEEEKRKYAEFLAKDYFTKSDFADLSRFYTDGGAYDRLSEGGKAEMNERVKEGVRRGKYNESDLPDNVEREVFDGEKGRNGRAASDLRTSSIERRRESATLASSPTGGGPDEMPGDTKPLESKMELPSELAGLSKLSSVQETNAVVVPQTERGSDGREIGG
ncbi:hypothetical protein KBB96_05070 [Luteolibacter ambystomatis]|uniref:Uncharacterized protein n=1 Tax=Luteolibacter ambystomatis TaxID=2824561 RepID=A0A975J1J0_9BACT|nr:hypothetical protein [Luteolibacter ambystomatis]QUE52264.1 hypothetical protein KBB96_05070 [Luteolibacter ambystomatis]